MALLIFIMSIFLLVLMFILYPVTLVLKEQIDYKNSKNYFPKVSLIISTYNEEKVIAEKLENCFELDYNDIEIIVADDGSIDKTVEVVKNVKDVILLPLSHRGKTAIQNEAVKEANGEIIVFSDANSMYEESAIKQLIQWFNDSRVGVVCGELTYKTNTSKEYSYWSYEKFLKTLESKQGKLIGANGSIYAVRKSCYIDLDETAISDFTEPLQIYSTGYDVIYEPKAVALEDEPISTFQRKRRIILRSLNSLKFNKSLFNLRYKRNLFWGLLLHKVLRWNLPVILFAILITNALLITTSKLFIVIFVAQTIFYGLGLFNPTIRYFLKVMCASLLAIASWIFTQSAPVVWETER